MPYISIILHNESSQGACDLVGTVLAFLER